MKKFDYNENPYQRDRNKKLPTPIAELLKIFKEIGELIKKNASEDTGFKGGLKTTSYAFESGKYEWKYWHGDDESGRTLIVDGKWIANHYDCYGNGEFEFIDENLIRMIHAELTQLGAR
ncbi:MAG: hypothetical protein ACR2PT_23720 [Endozoicomonas sp.]